MAQYCRYCNYMVCGDANYCSKKKLVEIIRGEKPLIYDPELGRVCEAYSLKIEKLVFNGPATIVFWKDGTKTVVKCGSGEVFDREKGLAMAMCKKALGNKGNFNNVFKKALAQAEEG